MELQASNTKQTLGSTISTLIVIAVLYLTVRLTGHAKAASVLFIGVLFIDLIAVGVLSILSATKLIKRNLFWIFSSIILLSLIVYFVYHQSYDSYNESRRVFWGLNGE
jgi:phosphoglycerol transferase MdoB-like AlkP superfamily enzyme